MTNQSDQDGIETTVTLLNLVRFGQASTRPELVRHSGLGRAVVAQCLSYLVDVGLVSEGDLARSTGGRAPGRSTSGRKQAVCLSPSSALPASPQR